jgi:hypothetical protein
MHTNCLRRLFNVCAHASPHTVAPNRLSSKWTTQQSTDEPTVHATDHAAITTAYDPSMFHMLLLDHFVVAF